MPIQATGNIYDQMAADHALATAVPQSRRQCAFETCGRHVAPGGVAITSARRNMMPFVAYDNRSFGSLEIFTAATAPATVSAARMGLYQMAVNGDWTLVAQTANDATIGSAINTQYTRTLDPTGGYPASYKLTLGQQYAFAFYITAVTTPNAYAFAVGAAGPSLLLPRVATFDNSGAGTDLNTTVTLANLGNSSTVFYGAGV